MNIMYKNAPTGMLSKKEPICAQEALWLGEVFALQTSRKNESKAAAKKNRDTQLKALSGPTFAVRNETSRTSIVTGQVFRRIAWARDHHEPGVAGFVAEIPTA